MSALSDDSTYTFLLTTMLMLLSVMTVGVCYLLQGAPLVRGDRVSGRGAAPPPSPPTARKARPDAGRAQRTSSGTCTRSWASRSSAPGEYMRPPRREERRTD